MNGLKALRRKFIIINMGTISMVLFVILAIVIGGNVQHYREVAFNALHSLVSMTNPVNEVSDESDPGAGRFQDANRDTDATPSVERSEDGETPEETPPPQPDSELSAKEQKAAYSLPGMVVAVGDSADDVKILFSRNMDTDTATAQKIVQAALDSGKMKGSLSDYNLSFLVRETPEGTKMAFVDQSYEQSSIRSLIFISVPVFVASWLIFLLLVWRLSIWVLRPVEEAWRQQRQFIADASHELKTPLTVILANTRILKNHSDDTIAAQMRWIDSSDNEALRMKKLVDSLLLLARNDANEDKPIATETFSMSDLVWGSILSFESVALDHGLSTSEEIEDDLSVTGDKAQLQEIMHILLDNACKYAKPASEIRVKLYQQDKKLHLIVHNPCDALSDEELDNLFKRFYRTDQSRARQTGGYGLGLAIAASICERHKGSITAANEDDGLSFHVTLPAAAQK